MKNWVLRTGLIVLILVGRGETNTGKSPDWVQNLLFFTDPTIAFERQLVSQKITGMVRFGGRIGSAIEVTGLIVSHLNIWHSLNNKIRETSLAS